MSDLSDFKSVKRASAVIVFTFVTKPFLFYLDCFYSNIHSFPEKFFYRPFLQRGNDITAVEAEYTSPRLINGSTDDSRCVQCLTYVWV